MSRMSHLPPSAPSSRATSGISRLAMMQARIQAQQLADKENKLLQFLEERQEAAIRRVAYGRDASYSATSLSSNSSNSMTAGVGVRPVPPRPTGFGRSNNNNNGNGSNSNDDFHRRLSQHDLLHSPNGWDKSYPLKPVDPVVGLPPTAIAQNGDPRTPLYKRNSSASSSAGGSYPRPNKYGGNYGPRGDYAKGRGVSLDRSRYNSPIRSQQQQQYNLTRTRSQAQLGHSSGEDSYGSSSRPPSSHQLYGMMTTSAYAARQPPVPVAGSHWRDLDLDDIDDDISSPRLSRKTSYTREYVRNLPLVVPPVTAPASAPPTGPSRVSRFSRSTPRLSDPVVAPTYDHSSYSSQSSEKSEPQAFSVIPTPKRSPSFDREPSTDIYSYATRPRINSQTYRKNRSPTRELTSRTGSPSRSPDRRSTTFGSDQTDRVNNNNAIVNNNANNNNMATLQRQREVAAREEEKRQLQLEMRRREQELLNKIKEQQQALENMKQEKLKYEREIQRQEMMRDRERKTEEERVQQQQQQSQSQLQQQLKKVEELSRPKIRETPLANRKRFLSRSSSNTTIGNGRPSEVDDGDLEEEEPVHLPQQRLGRSSTSTLSRSREVAPTSTPSMARKPPQPSAPPQSANVAPRRVSSSPQPVRRQLSPRKIPAERNIPTESAPAGNGTARRSIFAPKARDDLISCSNCGRNFAEDRIEKHTEICIKTSKKKRKTFDMTKKRLQGTDAEQFLKKLGKPQARQNAGGFVAQQKAQQGGSAKKGDWRKKREEFIAVLRAAKEAQRHIAAGGKISDLPPPPPMDTSDYIKCPHCGRKFSESAADRHIPKCKDIKSNKGR